MRRLLILAGGLQIVLIPSCRAKTKIPSRLRLAVSLLGMTIIGGIQRFSVELRRRPWCGIQSLLLLLHVADIIKNAVELKRSQ